MKWSTEFENVKSTPNHSVSTNKMLLRSVVEASSQIIRAVYALGGYQQSPLCRLPPRPPTMRKRMGEYGVSL